MNPFYPTPKFRQPHFYDRQVGTCIWKSAERFGLLFVGRRSFPYFWADVYQIFADMRIHPLFSVTAGFTSWTFFALKLTLLIFPGLSPPLFSFLRTKPSVLPGSECRWIRMVFCYKDFSPLNLWFKEKTVIHKATVHSRNFTKSPKHCLTHSKSSAWLLKWEPTISWRKKKCKYDLSLQSCSLCHADISLLGMNSPVCLEADCKRLVRDQTTCLLMACNRLK